MRKVVLGAVAAMLFTLLVAGTAWAAGGRSYVSANEIALAKALMKRGIISPRATRVDIEKALHAYLAKKMVKPVDAVFNYADFIKGPRDRALTSWGRVIRYSLAQGRKTEVGKVLVILVEFSEDPADAWNGKTGPLHGKLPAPKKYDNATYWPGTFTVKHYQDMLFGTSYKILDAKKKLRGVTTATMRNYFLEQSGGKFTVAGTVGGWVTVPHPEAYYGADGPLGVDMGGAVDVSELSADAIDALAAQNPSFPWAQYDQKNPWGIAGSNPNVPDGYIDHLVIIHAGADQAAGGGDQGDDAIWSHSAWVDPYSGLGPGSKGGHRIPGTAGNGIWIGPYTMDPEDGAAGVFCHEFGHDLGLPDEYSITYSGESPIGFWSVMDNGSWSGKTYGMGYRPAGMNAWDKYRLGWLTPTVVKAGKVKKLTLEGAARGNRAKAGFKVPLPPISHTVPLGDTGGGNAWYSYKGNNLDNTLTSVAKVHVPAVTPLLSVKTWYDTEEGYDFALAEVSTDGVTWQSLQDDGGLTMQNSVGAWGLTGISGGGDTPDWVTVQYPLDAFAGQDVFLRFHYQTDPAVAGRGWEVTDISLGTFSDNATADPPQFDTTTWKVVSGDYTADYEQYYIGEYRNWAGFDLELRQNYQYRDVNFLQVDWYPYSQGLLLLKYDAFFNDDITGDHPGEGFLLPLDARPYPDFWQYVMPTKAVASVNYNWRSRVQTRDAAFSLRRTPAVELSMAYWFLHQPLPGRAPSPVFDDSWMWWYDSAPDAGVFVNNYGVHIQVLTQTKKQMTVEVDNPTVK